MFSDLTCTYENNTLQIGTWGPSFRIREMFPVSVAVSGREILAAPVRLVPGFDGKTEHWTECTGYFSENTGERIVYHGQAIAGNVRLNLRLTAEKDGLFWYDILLLPQTGIGTRGGAMEFPTPEELPPRLDSLVLEIPVRTQTAELFHFWPRTDEAAVTNSGFVPETETELPFRPVIWLGNEEAGISFYAESDENWNPADRDRVLTVRREADAAVLRVHLLDAAPELWARRLAQGQHPFAPVKFSFGLQATPVKPYVKKQGFERDFMQIWGYVPKEEGAMDAHLREVAAKGVRWYSLHEDWSMLQNYGLPADESAVRTFVRKVHEHGMRTIPYFGYEYASAAPDFFENGDAYVRKTAEGDHTAVWHRDPHQVDYIVCYAGGYSQVQLERCIDAMDDYGFDGIYLDGTIIPQACANAAHGCGYTDPDGVRHATYPLRACRRHIKALSRAVHERGGIVEAHQSGCCVPMLMAYCDSYFDGEHLSLKPGEKLSQALDVGAMRAEFTGFNWGLPVQFCLTEELMHAKPADCFGMLMLYGVDIKAYGDTEKLVLGDHWKIMDDFGTADSVFYPCWHKEKPVRVSGSEMFCAAWVKGDRVLALAVNLGDGPAKAELLCDGPVTDVRRYGSEETGLSFTAEPRKIYFVGFRRL